MSVRKRIESGEAVGIVLVCALLVVAPACGDTSDGVYGPEGTLDFEPSRPSISDETSDVEPYEGSNDYVLEAQERFPTAIDFHRKVIHRTCSPSGGVCHNQKEYPDMHTPSNFLSIIDAPCNLQTESRSSVFDRCERPGDRFAFRDEEFKEIEIGWVERIKGEYVDYKEEEKTPEKSSPGLHVHLRKPVPLDDENLWGTGQFIRTFVDAEEKVRDLPFANFRTRWWILDDGRHLMAEVRDHQVDRVNELMSVGITQGDHNQNGTYGARESKPIALLEPGEPEKSYLIGRLRGRLQGEDVPGTRMPLANQPLSISEILALYCFVEGLPADLEKPPEGTRSIDYRNCSYSENPEQLNLLGEGVSWSGRIEKVLAANCGGCHGGESPRAGFNVLADDAYDQVLATSTQKPSLERVEPGEPEQSYLWMKINADRNDEYREKILGEPMPLDPLDGSGGLSDAERSDIKTWIENGAKDE